MGEFKLSSPKQLSSSPIPISSFSPPQAMATAIPYSRRPHRLSNLDLQPLDMDELEPLPPAEAHQSSRRSFESGSLPPSNYASRSANRSDFMENRRGPRSSTSSEHSTTSSVPYSARYVTVSAILSRSGAAIPIAEMENMPISGSTSTSRQRLGSGRDVPNDMRAGIFTSPPRLVRAKTFAGERAKRKEASNGSALEVLGALLLQRDSSGKVSSLSFARHQDDRKGRKHSLSKVSSAWLQGVKEAGAARLGIRMPVQGDLGQTIAQRRARKQGFLFQSLINRISSSSENIVEDGEQQFVRVGTTSDFPTFEVGKPKKKSPVEVTPIASDGVKLTPDLPPELSLSSITADKTPNGEIKSSSVFGIGSAFALNDPLDAPPSPIAIPGAWAVGGSGWNTQASDWRDEGALLLPPPLLDDQGSDAKSFEGLLGVRRMREQEKARKQLEKLKARNRPAHKVGLLTAFSNFVKAAHAADKASKAAMMTSRPSEMLSRRHTEPIHPNGISSKESSVLERAVPMEAEKENAHLTDRTGSNPGDQDMERSVSQGRKSLESVGRSLDTVFEGPSVGNDDWSHIRDNSSTRRSSIATSTRSILFETTAPRAPRLLPIHMSITSPSTPLTLDSEEGPFESEPPTPRLGPTLLSLPPSPWVHSSLEVQRSSLSLYLSMAPIQGPPGTPRLAPTSLEIAPSPFPLSPSFSPYGRSPRTSASLVNGNSTPNDITSPLSLSPLRSPMVSAMSRTPSHQKSRRTRDGGGASQFSDTFPRMTPTTLIESSAKTSKRSNRNGIDLNEATTTSSTAMASDNVSPQQTTRSFLLWFLFGDLGLKTSSNSASNGSSSNATAHSDNYTKDHGIFPGFLEHLYGFTIFILAHLVDLIYRIVESASMAFWFLRWMALNITGQTVLARCIIDAYGLVQKEWQTVSREDHEGRGATVTQKEAFVKTAEGLSRWQVVKGLIELVCLQDVTRERYLEEGAGLEELKGWKRKERTDGRDSLNNEWVDLGQKRQADRRALDSFSDSTSSEEEQDSDDDMVVTRQGAEILEFTKTPRIEPKSYFAQDIEQESLSTSHISRRGSKPDESNRALVKTIRWASRLAISAYGLHVTLVDLPATFTPSGNRFSRQTFAHLSRLHHEDVLHADIQTLDSETYSPTFYLVRDLSRKVVVVSVRGTQSLQDIIVDLEMIVDEVQLSDGEENKEKLFCHAGVLRAAKALISRESTLFKTLSEALEENKDFGIVFTGHSLGGAIASTVVLLLSRYVCDQEEQDNERKGVWVTHDDSGLPGGRTIRAITFAHPAAVNANLARRAGKGKIPLVLSVVLGSDIIPRCGHGQARELRRVLGGLSRVRKRKGDLFNQHKITEEDARIHIVTNWWRWKSVKRKGQGVSQKERKLVKRIEDDLWALRCDVENDLYAAVKQRSMKSSTQAKDGEKGEDQQHRSTIPPSPWVGPTQRAKAPLHQLASRRQDLDAITLENEESISASGMLVPAGQSILIYKNSLYQITSPLSFFSLPDFHPRMFAEHFPSAYETALLEDIKL